MFIGAHAVFRNVRPISAMPGKPADLPLLTGGLLVRIQPEEPDSLVNSSNSRSRSSDCDATALFGSRRVIRHSIPVGEYDLRAEVPSGKYTDLWFPRTLLLIPAHAPKRM